MKRLKNLVFGLVVSLMFAMNVSAASGSISASTGTKTATVGSTFTVTVKVNCSEAIGSWQFGISYDSSNISLVSGDTSVAGYGDGSMRSKSYTYKFKAIKSGKAGIRISSPSMVSWNDDSTLFTPSSSGVTVTVKTQAEIEASYSKDNTLKALSVEGYELTPAFSKNVTEYSVSVPDTVEQIKVNASKNESHASVSGAGTIDISEGTNKVEVVVTAQNGAVKTYTITVDVKDLNPIEVKTDEGDFTVVKKADLLTSPVGYTPTTIKIGEVEVPAFKSELTGMVVVGLKDAEGKIYMYSYDEASGNYKKYIEIKGNSVTLYPQNIESIPDGYSKTNLKINDVEYEVLKNDRVDDFYLVYAMNVETGKTDYYIYDAEDNSFIKYNSEAFEGIIESSREYLIYLVALGGVSFILLLIAIIQGRKNSKLKKAFHRLSQKEDVVTTKKEEHVSEEKEEHKDETSDSLGKSGKKKRK